MPFAALIPLIAAGVSAVAGMAMQGKANKDRKKEQDEYNRKQLEAQKELNKHNQGLGMETWKNTNYEAQRREMSKAGLNVGLMYGNSGGQGGTMAMPSGSAQGGQAQEQGDIAQKMTGMGMQAGLQTAVLQAQKENIEANTEKQKAETTNVIEGTAGTAADSRNKSMNADITEATFQEQIEKLRGEADITEQNRKQEHVQTYVDQWTSDPKIEQEQLKALEMGVEIVAKQTGITLTEAQIEETTQKINKLVTEIQNMKNLTEIQRQNMLSQRMQTEFNTSTAAQVGQYTKIAAEVMNATKKGKVDVKNDNRRTYDNSRTNYNE